MRPQAATRKMEASSVRISARASWLKSPVVGSRRTATSWENGVDAIGSSNNGYGNDDADPKHERARENRHGHVLLLANLFFQRKRSGKIEQLEADNRHDDPD